VPNIEDFYQGIDASIVPLFFGSGTRVKVIEASRLAIPCVSTAIGVEGCPLRSGHSYLNAESIEDWVSVLRSTTQTEFQMIGGFAFEAMKSNYDSENCSKELIAAIKQSIS
jgi:glycosyltransferase involved in cell wall biosynthesis